jgi:hypothetical protein
MMTGRPQTIAVLALVVFSRTTGAQHPTSQARGQSADALGGDPPILSRRVTGADGAGQPPLKKDPPARKTELTTKAARLAFIQKAQVWAPTDVPRMDLRAGPEGPGAFHPNAAVTCDYVPAKLPGTSPKFDCDLGHGDIVKVRYGAQNGKVEAAVIASRLLWALGFGADRLYPVVVTCRGCAPDPWTQRAPAAGVQVFDPAAIERKPKGHEMKSEYNGGWTWPELDRVDEPHGGAPSAQRDALKLLAVFMQHTDNKPLNERLLCLSKERASADACDQPFMMLHDVGLTFGHANFRNRNTTGSLNFEEWSTTPIWRDPVRCVAHMSKSFSGTLGNPTIHEAGRQFLADRLVQLTDQQLHDLFAVARVERRSRDPNHAGLPPATVAEWVAAFQRKRDEIVTHRCPS